MALLRVFELSYCQSYSDIFKDIKPEKYAGGTTFQEELYLFGVKINVSHTRKTGFLSNPPGIRIVNLWYIKYAHSFFTQSNLLDNSGY